MDWFLYDNGLRHERVNCLNYFREKHDLRCSADFLIHLRVYNIVGNITTFKVLPKYPKNLLFECFAVVFY